MKFVVAALLSILGLSGCATDRHARGGETITYQMQGAGICLACSSYAVTLGPDGQGIFTGLRNTAASGEQRFQVTRSAVRAFSDRLRRYRPAGDVRMNATPPCRILSTDQNTVEISWQGTDGPADHLIFYAGCDYEKNRGMADALFAAPEVLPIDQFIGKR